MAEIHAEKSNRVGKILGAKIQNLPPNVFCYKFCQRLLANRGGLSLENE